MENKDKYTLKEALEVIAKHMQELAKSDGSAPMGYKQSAGEMGKTKSGKNIFHNPNDKAHDDFTAEEHKDAAEVHMTMHKEKGGKPGGTHENRAKIHLESAALGGKGK